MGLPRASFYRCHNPLMHKWCLTVWLRSQGHQSKMQKMGLAAIYPKSKPIGMDKPSKTYPYLLRGRITSPTKFGQRI